MMKTIIKIRMTMSALIVTNSMLLIMLVAVKVKDVYTVTNRDLVIFSSTLVLSIIMQIIFYYILQSLKNKQSNDKFNKLINVSNYFTQQKIYKENA